MAFGVLASMTYRDKSGRVSPLPIRVGQATLAYIVIVAMRAVFIRFLVLHHVFTESPLALRKQR